MNDALIQRLLDHASLHDELVREGADDEQRQWADDLRAAVAEIERLIAERNAAFDMSRCECGTNEACANLVSHLRRAESAEAELAKLRARITKR